MTPKDYLRESYARVLIPDESGGYYGEILEFPGCFAEGDSVEETYRELENAAESWVEVRLSQGQEVPLPFSNLDYSGVISLRIPRTVHKHAAIMAARDKVSLNSFLMSAVSSRIGAEDLYSRIEERLERRLLTSFTNMAEKFAASTPIYHVVFNLNRNSTGNRKVLQNIKAEKLLPAATTSGR